MLGTRDWVAAPSPEWVAEYENADVSRRHFMIGFSPPPEIPAAILPTVERHQGEQLFYTWRLGGTQAQLQWVSPRCRPPFASWQVFLLRGALRAIQRRRRIASKTTRWLLKVGVAVGLSVGGPLAAWWIINHWLTPA